MAPPIDWDKSSSGRIKYRVRCRAQTTDLRVGRCPPLSDQNSVGGDIEGKNELRLWAQKSSQLTVVWEAGRGDLSVGAEAQVGAHTGALAAPADTHR